MTFTAPGTIGPGVNASLEGGAPPFAGDAPFASIVDFGGIPGAPNNDAALARALASFPSSGGGLYFPPGTWSLHPFYVPQAVSLRGSDTTSTRLVNLGGPTGSGFVIVTGSFTTVSDLTIDGNRLGTPNVQTASLQASKLNSLTGGGNNVSGGLTLAAPVTAGATSITVTSTINASSGVNQVFPDEIITLSNGTVWEDVRVAHNYTPGATTIPLVDPVVNTYTAAAFVTVACTEVTFARNRVYGTNNDAMSFWHCMNSTMVRNTVRDTLQAACDLPSAGSRGCLIADNVVDGIQSWGVAADTADVPLNTFGRTADNIIRGNRIIFRPGNPLSVNRSGIWLGHVDGMVVADNFVDFSRMQSESSVSHYGILLIGGSDSNGVNVQLCDIHDNTILGCGGTGVASGGGTGIGVAQFTLPLTLRSRIAGNLVRNVQIGIDLEQATPMTVTGNHVWNAHDYAINMLADGTNIQKLQILGNYTDTSLAGIREGGTLAAGSSIIIANNINLNASFAPIITDDTTHTTQVNNI